VSIEKPSTPSEMGSKFWSKLTPEERSAEIKRRWDVRREKAKSAK
jgi:hypothetical protein